MDKGFEKLLIRIIETAIDDYYKYPCYATRKFFFSPLYENILDYFNMDADQSRRLIFGHQIVYIRVSSKLYE